MFLAHKKMSEFQITLKQPILGFDLTKVNNWSKSSQNLVKVQEKSSLTKTNLP